MLVSDFSRQGKICSSADLETEASAAEWQNQSRFSYPASVRLRGTHVAADWWRGQTGKLCSLIFEFCLCGVYTLLGFFICLIDCLFLCF